MSVVICTVLPDADEISSLGSKLNACSSVGSKCSMLRARLFLKAGSMELALLKRSRMPSFETV